MDPAATSVSSIPTERKHCREEVGLILRPGSLNSLVGQTRDPAVGPRQRTQLTSKGAARSKEAGGPEKEGFGGKKVIRLHADQAPSGWHPCRDLGAWDGQQVCLSVDKPWCRVALRTNAGW